MHESKSPTTNPIDKFGIVVAVAKNGVIGIDGGIPWRVPNDRKIFKSLTTGKILVIGKRTFEEHADLVHVNHTRACIVVSRSTNTLNIDESKAPDTSFQLATSLDEALELANTLQTTGNDSNDDISVETS